jgi:hypothetical protein
MRTEFKLEDGTVRRLGNNLPVSANYAYDWPEYGSKDDEPIIDRSEWPALIAAYSEGPDDPNLPYVHDQNGIGQCNADATVTAAESVRMQKGLPLYKLSAADLYGRINGGRDRGSLLEDALYEMTNNGVGTAETSGLLWNRSTVYASAFERSRFKVLEFALCPTFDHCFSAVLKGRKMISGIMWYDNYTPDGDGWLPSPRGGAGGHAIFGYKPAMRNGKYGIWHQNSWTERYGLKGRFVIPEAAYAGPVGGWWAIREVVDEGGIVPIPQ